MAKFYITNAIPYVNAKPHIGHALEFIQSDVVARYHRVIGDDVVLLCGGDENALKNVQAAEKAGEPIQEFIDKNTKFFEELAKKLHVQFDIFQKGSDKNHHASSQKLWELCDKNGDIYKKEYAGLYCVGCELFYAPDELNKNGECFEHPGKKLEEVTEENYFFRLSNYKEKLLQVIQNNEIVIIPQNRKNEVLEFLKGDLQDISISRSNERARNWGVPVPGDNSQRMYVWFDALNIYQSGIGFGSVEQNDQKMYKKWWPADVHVIGKGILRFHAIYWPAFLLSAGLELPKKLFVHEYITVNGQKMSKTLGNVIDPVGLIEKYGAGALRYYLLAKISPFTDGDYSEEKFIEAYNADLANGLGNLVARVAKLAQKNELTVVDTPVSIDPDIANLLNEYRFNDALAALWKEIAKADKQINETKPWELEKEKANEVLIDVVRRVQKIAKSIEPFLPETSKKIQEQFKGPQIKAGEPLFPRI